MTELAWLEGRTEGGVHVVIDVDPYVNDAQIIIDGRPARITGSIVRYRDGGTTEIPTDQGLIWRPAPRKAERMGLEPSLDGKPLRMSECATCGDSGLVAVQDGPACTYCPGCRDMRGMPLPPPTSNDA